MSTSPPLSIAINTNVPGLCLGLGSMLEARGMAIEIVNRPRAEEYQLTYKPGLPMSRVAEVVSVLDSAQPTTIACDKKQTHDIVIHLPANLAVNADHRTVEVEITTDSQEMGTQLTSTFRSLGFQKIVVLPSGVDDNSMNCTNDFSEVHLALILLKARELGSPINRITTDSIRHRHHVQKIQIAVHDSRLIQIPSAKRYPVVLRTDDIALGQELADILIGHGFKVDMAEPLSNPASTARPLGIISGPMSGGFNRAARGILTHAIDLFVREKGVDITRYPINTSPRDDAALPTGIVGTAGFRCVIDLPIAASLNGTARSRGGSYPDRFNVKIITDCPEHSIVINFRKKLEDSGFTNLVIEESHDPRVCRSPLTIRVGSAGSHPETLELVQTTLTQAAEPLVNAGFSTRVQTTFTNTDDDIFINLPLVDWEEGTLLSKASVASGYDMRIHCEDPSEWDDVISELTSWGFDSFNVETVEKTVRPTMQFGGAPTLLLNRIATFVESKSTIRIPRRKIWPDGDDDIFVHLPARARLRPDNILVPDQAKTKTAPPRQEAVVPVQVAKGSFVRTKGKRVRIGTLSLHRRDGARHPLAPSLDRFGHFCLDQKTAHTLRHIATSVLMNEPCLLEGETSTSKTSTIEYLAALLGQPLVRINLNGQTDTGELLGRFVPNDAALGIDIPTATLALRPDLLDARSADIVQRAVAENRDLCGRERGKIATIERMALPAWRWQDGLVIQALRNGWWLLLDEVNLAETQILERLNSLLEAHPSLVLTEHSNEVFGDKGTPIHPSFRIFGTMNPAEYAGRSVLSPAYKDRWRGFRQVPGPNEPEYLAMLKLMVFGMQPSIIVDGIVYPGWDVEPSHPGLNGLGDIDEELQAFARFHASIEAATGEGTGQLGLRRKERPVFTRRSLLSVLDYISRVARPEPGTQAGPILKIAATRYYMDRVAGADDRQVVSKLLEASGIGMGVMA